MSISIRVSVLLSLLLFTNRCNQCFLLDIRINENPARFMLMLFMPLMLLHSGNIFPFSFFCLDNHDAASSTRDDVAYSPPTTYSRQQG
ncbi:hypothetical protein B0T13DRAFT_474230 [Neurospora crassa]|nr:hypothetical protein B0T13DRAFT_474230 [Neurospora crassa]